MGWGWKWCDQIFGGAENVLEGELAPEFYRESAYTLRKHAIETPRTSRFTSVCLHGRTLTVESIVLRTRELLRGRSPAPLNGLADLSWDAASSAEECTLRQHDRMA
jgi:hypothetical protein